jgi:hypothetical protein
VPVLAWLIRAGHLYSILSVQVVLASGRLSA